MLKITKTYHDYNEVERTEDFYFNLTKAELVEWNLCEDGGLEGMINKIIAEKDQKRMILLWKELVLKAYGVKSADGKRFIKNDEVRDAFVQCEAYSDIFMELATDDTKAAEFVKGIIPKMD